MNQEIIKLLEKAKTYCLRLNAISICGKISCNNGDIYNIRRQIDKTFTLLKQQPPFDEDTLEAIREAFSKEWRQKHKGEFCEGQVPQFSNNNLIDHAINFYVGSFMNK